MTKYEQIKNMDIEQMAAWLANLEVEHNPKLKRKLKKSKNSWMTRYIMASKYIGYLNSEVDDD